MHRTATLLLSTLAATSFTGAARAGQLEEAQEHVTKQISEKKNVLDKDCKTLKTKNGKNVCFLKDFPKIVLIGNANQRKADAVKEEYETLVTLGQWNVGAVKVGSEFIKPAPCTPQDKKFDCGAFLERELEGKEVHWASYQQELVESQNVKDCAPDNQKYIAKVTKAYRSTPVVDGQRTLLSLVQGKDENWREELSGDVTSAGQIFMAKEAFVVDLQAFVADDGNMTVFDPQGLSKDKKGYTCWSAALQIFGTLIFETK